MKAGRVFYTSPSGGRWHYAAGRVRVHFGSGFWSKPMKAAECLNHLQRSTAGPRAQQIEQGLRAAMAVAGK